MKKYIILFCLCFVFFTNVNASKNKKNIQKNTETLLTKRGDLRIVSYNIENLFDCKDDTTKDDNEFLPYGMKGWNNERYNQKLKNIYKVLVNIGEWETPEICAFYEIENRTVLEDLIERTPLSKFNYGIIHEESPDARGIDVGFIYKRDKFIPLSHQIIRVQFPFDTLAKTRDVLVVNGIVNKKDTVHIFVCHLPSRRGGETQSEPRRIYVAQLIRNYIDSLQVNNANANIIVLGDMNDEPTNKSMVETLQAKGNFDNLQTGELYNFMYKMKVEQGLGTYKFAGYWNMIDNCIVSQSLFNTKNNIYTNLDACKIYKQPWLEMIDEESTGTKPFRTYNGPNYTGGFSDHFAVFLDLFFKK